MLYNLREKSELCFYSAFKLDHLFKTLSFTFIFFNGLIVSTLTILEEMLGNVTFQT